MLEQVELGLVGTAPRAWGYGYIAIHQLLHWVIVGGESGNNSRVMDVKWARKLVDECAAAGTAVFFKQMGGRGHDHGGDLLEGMRFQQFPIPATT